MAMLVITRWYIVWGCSMFMHFPASHVRNHRRAILCSVSNFLSNSTPKWDPKIYRSHIISGSFWDDCGTTNQCQSMPVPEGILFGSPWSSRWCWRQICGAIRGEPGDAAVPPRRCLCFRSAEEPGAVASTRDDFEVAGSLKWDKLLNLLNLLNSAKIQTITFTLFSKFSMNNSNSQ